MFRGKRGYRVKLLWCNGRTFTTDTPCSFGFKIAMIWLSLNFEFLIEDVVLINGEGQAITMAE